ncbi:S8 family serine peptidase [Candidatus Parcubacteria bacterium]|nr:S8 family serine peptidase [Candidatus Parcubacteria bacterium]
MKKSKKTLKALFNISLLFIVSLFFAYPTLALDPGKKISRPDADKVKEIIEKQRKEIRNNVNNYLPDEIVVKEKGRPGFKRVRLRFGQSVASALRDYRGRKEIEYAEPNYIVTAHFVPNDTYYPYQWHLDNDDFGGINAETAWDTAQGDGVVVAVIDTGIAYENYSWYYRAPDLAQTLFTAGYDFYYNDSHPNDDNGHGTHVAGTIAQSTNNGLGVAGVAPRATLMPLKVLNRYGNGNYADLSEAIIWAADHNADIINMSLGGPSPATYLEEALAYAYAKGVTIFASSGNDYSSTVNYPAAYDEYVIAVGATGYDEKRAPYSNYGTSLDLVAPGGNMDQDLNGDGYDDGILQQTFGSRYSSFAYYFYQGTSMAAPHAAGVAALVISANIADSPDEIRSVLETTADDLGSAGWDTKYGHGLVNAAAALGDYEPPLPPPAPEPNNPPVADVGGPYSGTEDIAVTFDGSGSLDPDDDSLTYSWDFGDGGSGTGMTPGHIYAAGGIYTITLTVSDGQDEDASSTTADITEVNDLPVITSSPITEATVGQEYLYDVEATDPDGAISSYELEETAPNNMNINSDTGLIEWTPTETQVGSHDILVVIYDNDLASTSQTFTIIVNEIPNEPSGFYDSFESGLGNWTQDYQRDWFSSRQKVSNGRRSAEVDGRAQNAQLISPIINLSAQANARINFDWYIESGLDWGEYLAFDISINNNSWIEKARLRGNIDPENTWHSQNINIELSGVNTLRIRFRGTMSNSREDAFVDAVSVLGY